MTEVWFGKDKYHLHQEMYQWCRDHLGAGGFGIPFRNSDDRWGLDINFGNACFYFKHDADAVLFALKWQ